MKGRGIFFLNIFLSIVYIFWRIFYTIPVGYGAISVSISIILLVMEGMGVLESLVHFMNMSSDRHFEIPDVPLDKYPDVDVFISTYSEDTDLLYKTINGCKRMEYPDKNKVHIYLCDDNRRPEMEELAKRTGINYLKRANNEGAKAGNLNHALAHSSSPYIVTFDADMIPRRKFLMRLMPYIVDAEMKNAERPENRKVKLGFIQSPQNFYNPDLFQFNLFSEGRVPNEQDYFYRDIQAAMTNANSVIYGGSNTIISREALEAVGGFCTDGITEDFATGLLIEKKGFVSLGTSEPLASGLSPTDLPNLVQQRIRWARGVISTGRSQHIYTSKDLSFAQKLNYWTSVYYWYAPLKRLIYIISPILFATFGFTIFKCTLPQIMLFWLPMYVTSKISLKQLSGNIRSEKWTGIYETIFFPFLLMPVILETFGLKLKKFKVTSKEAQTGKQHYETYMVPFVALIALSLFGIFRCIAIIFESSSFGPVVVLFWLIVNLFYMVMAVLFIDGRVAYRKDERVPLTQECKVDIYGQERDGETINVSEEGISISFDNPYYLEDGGEVEIRMNWDIYSADIKAKLLYVRRLHERWAYSFAITDYGDSYEEWLQIVHDRIPPLPQELNKNSGIFDDLKINAHGRRMDSTFQKRMYPRILLDCKAKYYSGKKKSRVFVRNFNYSYIDLATRTAPKKMQLEITKGLLLDLIFDGYGHSNDSLYKVENIKEIIGDEEKYKLWMDFIVAQNKHARGDVKKEKYESDRRSRQLERDKMVVFDELKLV